jgi:hypothetical protein
MASFFVAKIWYEVFAHLQAVSALPHSLIRNWLFGLPGRILCEQYPWCLRKWWACSWLCSSPVTPFSACLEPGMSFKNPCTLYAFFPERLSNQCQGLRRTFSKIWTKFDAVPLSDPSRNHIRPDYFSTLLIMLFLVSYIQWLSRFAVDTVP